MTHIINNTDFEIQDEMLTFQNLIYVFIKCKQKVINIYHASRIHEY